ncbi:hypothetical protein ACI2KR_07130 [Pseudomonas luteola]
MKYSELVTKTEEEIGRTAYGIIVDELILDKKPSFLYRLGFELDSLDVMKQDNHALTVMITYMTTGEYRREIIAEIPFHLDLQTDMLLMLSGCKASISLLPPRSNDDSEWVAYTEKLKSVFEQWLGNSNINRLVYPLVGYFEYLVHEVNGYQPESITKDEYMLKRFVDEFDIDRMDQVKDDLKDFVHEYFGGRQGFKDFVTTVAISAQKSAEKECVELISRIS